jgi:hypothetical protein
MYSCGCCIDFASFSDISIVFGTCFDSVVVRLITTKTSVLLLLHYVSAFTCPEGQVKCKDNIQCIDASDLCDRNADCIDKSDQDEEFCKGNKSVYI